MVLANNEITNVKETLAYDVLTFISNFGGSLGLFVGFSFLMLWDFIAPVIHVIKKKLASVERSNT